MHLASITSSQQKSLPQGAHNSATFDGCKNTSYIHNVRVNSTMKSIIAKFKINAPLAVFWTGARDALGPTQFVWDFDKRPVSSVIDNY